MMVVHAAYLRYGGFWFGFHFTFAIFAMLPGWLQSLPKSGGWLTSVKVVLGFLESLQGNFIQRRPGRTMGNSEERVVHSFCYYRHITGIVSCWVRLSHDSPIKTPVK